MKPLIVLCQQPIPNGGAHGRCAVGLLKGLLSHGLEPRVIVTRQALLEPGVPIFKADSSAPSDVPIDVVPVRPRPASESVWGEWFRRPMAHSRQPDILNAIASAAASADVVHLDETQNVYADTGATPSLINVAYLGRFDAPLARPWRRRFFSDIERALAERAAHTRHRFIVANSPKVAAHFQRVAPKADVAIVPLTLDPSGYSTARLDGPPTAGIIGTGSWPPTAQAMTDLIRHVWPIVLRSVPNARLLIAGRSLRSAHDLTDAPSVELVGDVPSAADFLKDLSLLLFPLSRGSGMKVKVLESIATGLPVVTTPCGAEGIDGDAGIIVESDHRRLANAAISILSDEHERRERGAAARYAFTHRYSPAAATEPLVDLYRRMGALVD